MLLRSRRAGETLKVVIPGGSGQVGQLLARVFKRHGHRVIVLGRQAKAGVTAWDGQSLGDWAREFDDADVGNEPDVPAYWGYSIQIAQAWEATLAEANTMARSYLTAVSWSTS